MKSKDACMDGSMARIGGWSVAVGLAAIGLMMVQSVALAQGGAAYPSRPVKLVVGAPPGGDVDITARIAGKGLSENLGQPIIVVNRPGAGGSLAFNLVRQAAGDPYTLLMVPTGFTTGVALNPNAGYDPVKDFSPISTVSYFSYSFAVGTQSPYTSPRELLAAARERPPAHWPTEPAVSVPVSTRWPSSCPLRRACS